MMKKLLLLFAVCLSSLTMTAATGWPAQYKGVMLQAFYWDSYSDSRWTKLTEQADQMAFSFDLIWIPQAGKPAGSPSMGYDPVYWISNWNSSFGNETELKTMISTFKQKGTGILADLVINHRGGVSNAYNFPNETVGSYSIQWPTPYGQYVTKGDENVGTGNYDTGEGFSGFCDLDHTNTRVQNNCKTYCKFMIDQMGFAGFRLDMVKGYSGSYTQMYNNAANVTYSVGEYWDGSYDAVTGWINSTGKTSAAFDYPLYYGALQRFNDGNFAGDFSNKGMAGDGASGNGMQRYAVTFVDNHDTYQKDDHIKNNVEAANAFILTLPGTPCIFLPHWKAYKTNLQKMIAARKAAGVHNQSAYTEGHAGSGYWLESTGTSYKILGLFGSITLAQAGKSASQYKLVASGTNFKYYISNPSYKDPTFPEYTPSVPEKFYLLGTVQGWEPTSGLEMTKSGDTFTWEGTLPGSDYSYFAFTSELGAWDDILSKRYGAASKDLSVAKGSTQYTLTEGTDNSFKIAPGDYKLTVTFTNGVAKLTIAAGQPTPEVNVDLPSIATFVEGKQFCYFEKPDTYGNTIYAWAWKKGTTNTNIYSAWPGSTADITYVGNTPTVSSAPAAEGVQRAAVGSNKRLYRWVNNSNIEATHIIFNDGTSGGHQTADLTFDNGAYYQGNMKIGVVSQSTGISDITTETSGPDLNSPIYTVDGRRVSLNSLVPGIYIQNGKKLIVK